MTVATPGGASIGCDQTLIRAIDWKGAFWVASGVPALVLFSIGGIAGNTGNLAFLIWTVSMIMGFAQSFTYAEIAGLFPSKSGGASVYGAAAWVRYGKLIAPLSVWCNWIAWSPVLSLGCSIAAAYILNAVAPLPAADSQMVMDWLLANGASVAGTDADKLVAALTATGPAIRSWTLYATALGPVRISLNSTFFIGAALMLGVFAIQHRGIVGTAKVQMWIGIAVVVPMAIVGIIPILIGKVDWANFSPFVPLAAANSPQPGHWNIAGWTLTLGGLFIASWSTYAFETAICYTSEFRNPASDTFKAIFYSGLLCLALFILVPFTFQGVLGVTGMLAAPIVDGSGVAEAMARMVSGGAILQSFLVMMMILALILSIMTAMAGSSRTLYQGSADGWLPRYLSHLNAHGAPTRAMWTDLGFNLGLLAVAAADAKSYFFILAVSNCAYIIFNFLNLNAGWIHRIDAPRVNRPFKAPIWLLGLGTALSFVNAALMGAGAKVWNVDALWAGVLTSALVIPVFLFRHYVQDRGRFPAKMLLDLHVGEAGDPESAKPRAGLLPYLALLAGALVVIGSNWFFQI